MRPSLEISPFRVVVLASGLALFAAACGSSSGKPSGAGGSSADAGSDTKTGAGGAGNGAGGKADGGGDSGTGGKADSGTDGGAGGKVDSGTDSGAGGMAMVDAGQQLTPPWRSYLPLVTAAAGSAGASGTSLDISPNHYDATWFGTITFGNGAANFTGNTFPAEEMVIPAKGGVTAIDTTGSYSVQAWVTMTDVGGYQTVVSGEGFNIASFFLQKRVDLGGAWFFTTPSADSTSAPACISPPLAPIDGGPAQNPVVVVVNRLYHLVATRDATTGTQILYVDGVESGRNTCAGGFPDTGILGIGHGVFNGGRTDFTHGAISDVGVINRVLTPVEVAALHAKGRTFVPPPLPDAGPDLAPATDGGTDVPVDAPAGNDAPAGGDAAADGG